MSGWSDEELLHEILVEPRRAFVPLPDLRLVERPGWLQILTPSFRQGGMNEVCFSALADDESDAVIDATVAEYRELGLRFRWVVGPDSAPADLAARLERRGLKRTEICGMWRATADPPAAPADVAVERVDATTVDEFTHTMGAGWNMDAAPMAALHAAVLADPAQRQQLYLARIDGRPAGIASTVGFARSAYLMAGVVLPAFRRRGVYRALVAARLRAAAALGLGLATVQARAETSAPLLQRLGFATRCRFPIFAFER